MGYGHLLEMYLQIPNKFSKRNQFNQHLAAYNSSEVCSDCLQFFSDFESLSYQNKAHLSLNSHNPWWNLQPKHIKMIYL